MATGRLTENMHAAKTRAEQDEALAMLMRFMNHERDKRLHDPE